MTPPIRFLASALASWACLRGAMLVPWHVEEPRHDPPAAPGDAARSAPVVSNALRELPASGSGLSPQTVAPSRIELRSDGTVRRTAVSFAGSVAALPQRAPGPLSAYPARANPLAAPVIENPFARQTVRKPALSRWTASAWLHGRSGEAAALAPGGSLGGSQAGARLRYRLSPALLLTGRVSAPLRRPAGAEAAIGVEWQPLASVPLRLLGERRQKLGRDGRSAFAVTLHGGVGELPLPAGFRLDAYGQAGVLGARSQDLFADASARAARPIGGGISLGAGVWAAAQPGAARLDAGPSVVLRLPKLGASLSADWRFRAAGHARPGSGPALTLMTDF
jgi:hypothetical protein